LGVKTEKTPKSTKKNLNAFFYEVEVFLVSFSLPTQFLCQQAIKTKSNLEDSLDRARKPIMFYLFYFYFIFYLFFIFSLKRN
jgi:hypothetical protein